MLLQGRAHGLEHARGDLAAHTLAHGAAGDRVIPSLRPVEDDLPSLASFEGLRGGRIGQAFGGIISVLSDAGDMKLTGTCLADLVTGLSTATGILAALVGHGRTGTGTRLQTSIVEAVSTITVGLVNPSIRL